MKKKRKKTTRPAPSPAINDEQLEYCQNLFILGYKHDKIQAALSKKFNAKPPIAEIKAVADQLMKDLREENPDPETERRLAKRRLEIIYMKSFAIQDFKTCLGVQKEINRLSDQGTPGKTKPSETDW